MVTPRTAPAAQHFGFLKGGEDHLTQCLGDRGFPSGRGPDLWRDHGPALGENGGRACLYLECMVPYILSRGGS